MGGVSQYGYLDGMNKVEVYQPDSDIWRDLEAMPQKMFAPGAVWLPWGTIMVFGGAYGYFRNPDQILDTIYLYDTETNRWRSSNMRVQFEVYKCSAAILP